MNRYLDVAPEVQEAIKAGKPVVALESTIICHGMPYPQNVETALNVEKIIRESGAVPATIAIIGGRLKAGLTPEEIDYLGKTGAGVTKASRRDLPVLVAERRDGATTVTTTMMIAAHGRYRGVRHRRHRRRAPRRGDHHGHLRRSGGAGPDPRDGGVRRRQVHSGSGPDPGVSGDPRRPCHRLPAPRSCPPSTPASPASAWTTSLDTPAELAEAFHVKRELGLRGGMLVTNPIPEEYSMDADVINKAIDEAVEEAKEQGIHGKETTPFLLAKIKDITGGDSLDCQHPAGVQQRPSGRCHRSGAQQAA